MTAKRHKQIIDAIIGKVRQIVPAGAEVIDDYTYPLRELGWGFSQCINAIWAQSC